MPQLPSLRIEILAVAGIPELRPGMDLAEEIWKALGETGLSLEDGDVLVVTQKVVSKVEGRLVASSSVEPSPFASDFAKRWERDPRAVEVVLRQARRIVKMDRGILVTETHHGYVCANSGVDASNLVGEDTLALLPLDPDASAAGLRRELEKRSDRKLAVIVSDTFGRPWREGVVNVAIGVSGMDPIQDYRGENDAQGRPLTSTRIASADEIASAAELVMGKLGRVPVALVRGLAFAPAEGSGKALVRDAEHDLFR